jgi:hypothetical protein
MNAVDIKVLKAIQLTTAATASASCDTVGADQIAILATLGVSTTTTLTATLEISSYDSTAASTGTSLTTLMGTSQVAAFTLNGAPTTILANYNSQKHGRYLYAVLTNNGKAESALHVLGFKLSDAPANSATGVGVTTLVNAVA